MKPLGRGPISMSDGQQESWHRERVWVRYQKEDLPSASSCSRLHQALNPTNSRLLSTTPPQRYMFYVVFNRGLISYWSEPCSMQTHMRERRKSIWIPRCIAVFQVYWVISFSLSVFSMVKGLTCVLTLNNGHVATAALPAVGSCVIQRRNQVRLLS